MARLLLGVSGGISAYKALELVRLATKAGHSVRVIQTPNSEHFVGRASFEAITGAPVLVSEFEPDPARGSFPGEEPPARAPISHLALAERAQAYLIAPAAANTIAKLAHGHADNLLTAAALAAACPIALAPAMNARMWAHAATQANIGELQARGVSIVVPEEGELASYGEEGLGRMAEPPRLLAAWQALLEPAAGEGSWAGVRVLVSAGGTREPIDSVRYIGNRSSGRMGVAIATRAAARGAEVVLVGANLAVPPPPATRAIAVRTAAELKEACVKEFERCDVLLMAAAVADFRPAAPVQHKLKKDSGPPPAIELEPTEDILSALATSRRPEQLLVGFAAEDSSRALEYGRHKLESKRLDAVVVNDIADAGVGFDSEENEVAILTIDGRVVHVPRESKEQVADAILEQVGRLRTHREEAGGTPRTHAGSFARA